MQTLIPPGLGPIHFAGIGGIGMSGIAEILLHQGHAVQGSDLRANAQTDRLAGLGARIFVGQRAENVAGAAVCVVSTAIKPDNPELMAARAAGIPVVRRAEMLAELMRLRPAVSVTGTHGKTTTTTLVAALMDAGGFDPLVVNGGVIHAYGSNARAGSGDWAVVEADESDGSFNLLPATIGIVTNIDPEHLDHWGNFDALRAGFDLFVRRLPFYGLAVLCTDHPEVRALADRVQDRPVVTFGLQDGANLQGINLRFENGQSLFDIALNWRGENRIIESLSLTMPGAHNVSNALSAVAVALHLGMSDSQIRAGLAAFRGVGRRFTQVARIGGITVIDDYGHHPVEIAAVLRAARQALGGQGRLIAVHQPHRYSRLSSLFDQFCTAFAEADVVGIAEVYAAGEDPIPGATRDDLVAGIRASGHADARAIRAEPDLEALVREQARPGDMVVCLGAGTISAWAYGLPARLADLETA